jgi:hypothetical protein
MSVTVREMAEVAVDAIIYDLDDRRGLKHEWRAIDEDIRRDIREAWIAEIEKVFGVT